MKKINFKIFYPIALVLVAVFSSFLVSLFTSNTKVLAQTGDAITIETTWYSALSASSYVFGGYYYGNTDKRGFTTYFEFKKDDSNLDSNAEKTVAIVRNTNVPESNEFYSSPELKLFSVYYFRAVGYFNDTPNQKFYGNVLSFKTGDIPPGTTYPFTVEWNGTVIPFDYSSGVIPFDYKLDGGWSLWSTWSACSVTACGEKGTEMSTRTCTSPTPANGGADCSSIDGGNSSKTQSCQTEACPTPVNGGWSGWSPASCPTACGQPESQQVRTCTSPPPSNGGADCGVDNTQNCGATAACTSTNPPATPSTSLVKCGTSTTSPCGFNDIITLIKDVINFIFVYMALPLAAIMFAYAGFELVTSGGSTEKKSKAKKIFLNVAIGLVLVAAAFLIVHTILGIAGYDTSTSGGWNWFGF